MSGESEFYNSQDNTYNFKVPRPRTNKDKEHTRTHSYQVLRKSEHLLDIPSIPLDIFGMRKSKLGLQTIWECNDPA